MRGSDLAIPGSSFIASWRILLLVASFLQALSMAGESSAATFIPPSDAQADLPADIESPVTVSVTPSAIEAELGKAFSLDVIFQWRKDLIPEDRDDIQLEPLTMRLTRIARRETENRIEEVRRYQCYAFSLVELSIPALRFKARTASGDVEETAFAEPLSIRIKPVLNPEDPGPVELPCGLLSETKLFPWKTWLGAGLLFAVLTLYLGYHVRKTRQARTALRAVIPPYDRALERLDSLRARLPKTAAEIDAFHVEASALVRDYIGDRFGVRAPKMTTEQFLSAPLTESALDPDHRDLLADYLVQCDYVKFARRLPTTDECRRLLEAVARFLDETRSADPGKETGATAAMKGGAS